MAQLDYMEKRGSGLTRICNETKALEGYKDELKPVFKSTPTQFHTIIPQSRGQVLGHDGCYDSGTCPYDYSQKIGVLKREGKDNDGKWVIISVSH